MASPRRAPVFVARFPPRSIYGAPPPRGSPSACSRYAGYAIGELPGRSGSCSSRPCRDRGSARARPPGRSRRPRDAVHDLDHDHAPCGPPKPRNAVCEVTFVFATRGAKSTFGEIIRIIEVEEAAVRDRLREVQRPATVRIEPDLGRLDLPSSSKPTWKVAWNRWRLPVSIMSRDRDRAERARACPSSAPRGAPRTTTTCCPCVSLPPKPPPMRGDCTKSPCSGDVEHARRAPATLRRMLRRRGETNIAVLAGLPAQAAMRLEVKCSLTADVGSPSRWCFAFANAPS